MTDCFIGCLTDCLIHCQIFGWLIGPNLQLSMKWPISSRKHWINAALKHFILKEHKTIKRGSESKNSWQCYFTVAWITGKYYQHISPWKGLQQSKLGEASGSFEIHRSWLAWLMADWKALQGAKCESQVKRWLNRPSSDWLSHKTRLFVISHTLKYNAEAMLRDALHGVNLGISVIGHLIKGVCIADDQETLASSVKGLQLMMDKIEETTDWGTLVRRSIPDPN